MGKFVLKNWFNRIIIKLGQSIWSAQRLEFTLSYIMILANDEVYGSERMEEYQMNLNKKTLGQLINKLKVEIAVDDKLSTLLQDALEARNYVAHKFGNDRVNSFTTISGCKESLKILSEKDKIINDAYNALIPLIEEFMKARGINIKLLNNVVEYEILSDKFKDVKKSNHKQSRTASVDLDF